MISWFDRLPVEHVGIEAIPTCLPRLLISETSFRSTRQPMTTRRAMIFMSICLSSLAPVHSQDSTLSANEEIRFDRETVIKIFAPCTIEPSGSKLTVFPQSIDFSTFKRSVDWEIGIPGYLSGTEQDSTKFNFDLTGRLTFKSDVVLRIIRTTANVTADGILIVHKGSVRPRVLKNSEDTP